MGAEATKIESATADIRAALQCDHNFTFVKWLKSGGQVKTCSKCKCRFTSWPGSDFYDPTIERR